MVRFAMLQLFALLALAGGTSVLATPSPGEKAPVVKVDQWITQKPPALPGQPGADKHVFVVEFWATWCGPCRVSIPHLAKLHERLGSKGLAIVSLSNEEPETVKAFAQKNKMPYYVGCYDEESETAEWTSKISGIPTAFIVDRSGQVVWRGHPMSGLDAAVEKVLAGTFDLAAEKKRASQAADQQKVMRELQTAYSRGQKDRALELAEQWVKLDPTEVQGHMVRRRLMLDLDRPAEELAAATRALEDAIHEVPTALLETAQLEMSRPTLAERDPGLAYRCAHRAVVATQGKDADALQVLARVQCELGMIDAALATQQKAVEIAAGEGRDQARAALKYFESAKALSLGGATAMGLEKPSRARPEAVESDKK